MTPRIGSLFSGYGGLDLAVQRVYGGEVVWYSEIELAACKVLAAHHPGVPNLGDITKVDWADVEPVDILTGGYPCQPFSKVGHRKGAQDARHLWPHVYRAICALRPGLIVLENVRDHLSLGFDSVLADLARVGYAARWGTVRASDAGAPHGRARLFITSYPDSDEAGPTFRSERLDRGVAGTHGARPTGADILVRSGASGSDDEVTDDRFGPFGHAVSRWARIIGRPAPVGLTDEDRLNPRFSEWMMGLPDGYVTAHDLTDAQALKMLGNGVVPQQAELALRMLAVAA